MTQFLFKRKLRTVVSCAVLAFAAAASGAVGPAIQVNRDGTNVVIDFSGRLQSSPAASGPFTSVAGSRSPFIHGTTSGSNQFWRTVLNDVRSIAAGDGFSMAIRNDGTLWTWGANNYGQLGLGHTDYSVEPAQVGTNRNWRTVSAGAGVYHALAIRDDSSLWAWGDNRFGQLGLGHTNGVTEPIRVGAETIWESVAAGWRHTMAIRTDGTLWACGGNRFGQLGIGTTNNVSVLTQVGSAANWVIMSASVGAGGYGDEAYAENYRSHTVAMRTDGTIWAWGDNQYGQLGLGGSGGAPMAMVTAPMQTGGQSAWRSIVAGGGYTVAIQSDGSLWEWGALYSTITNQPSRIEDGTNWDSASAGAMHAMAIRHDGSLWAWGEDRAGQLGLPTSANEYNSRYRADFGGPRPSQVGTNGGWIAVVAGTAHTIALRDDASVWSWGGGGGIGRVTVGSSTTNVQIGAESNWRSVDAGRDFTIALRGDGTIWGWGGMKEEY